MRELDPELFDSSLSTTAFQKPNEIYALFFVINLATEPCLV